MNPNNKTKSSTQLEFADPTGWALVEQIKLNPLHDIWTLLNIYPILKMS